MSDGLADSNNDTVLRIDQISKFYGRTQALDKVSFQIKCGQFFALLGPNGAGKTTLFQLLTGLFVADEGKIEVDGLDIRSHATAVLANIGVVFQQPTLDLDLSVRVNLEFHGLLHGMSRKQIRQRIKTELDRLEVSESAGQVCRKLSGGNRRKVELARALLHEPTILLMDEATVGLDPASRRMLLEYVRDLCRSQSISVLWTTHLVDEVEDADQVVVLQKGHVLEQGSPPELLSKTNTESLTNAFIQMTRTEHAEH